MRSVSRALLVQFSLALALASTLGVAACGGSGGDGIVTPPPPPPPPDPVTRVAITPDTGSAFVGESVALTAHAYTAKGTEVTGKTVSWGTPDASVATVDASGTVHFLAAGLAHITATVDGSPGNAVFTGRPSPPARLVLTPAAVLVGTGQAVATTVAVTDRQGAPIASPSVTYTSTNASVASVSSAGTIASLSAGTARVIASLATSTGSLADTTVVTVGGGAALSITLPDTVIAPAQTLKLGGAGLASATASIGGIAVPLANVTGTSADLTVPASLFQPCLRAGVTYPVVVRVGSDSVVGQLAAQAVPVQVSLAPGGHVIVQAGLDRGCAIATSAGGTYMLMPYTWDQDYSRGQPPQTYTGPQPTVNGTISVIGAPTSVGTAAQASRTPFGIPTAVLSRSVSARSSRAFRPAAPFTLPTELLERPPVGSARPGRHASLSASGGSRTLTPTASCIPMTVGSTVRRYTSRNASGWANQFEQPTDPIEPWYVAGVGSSIAVVVDSTMWRVLQSDTAASHRLQVVVAAYDSSVAPMLTAYLGTPPDIDGNGRLLLFMPFWGGPVSSDGRGSTSYGGPLSYDSPDCTQSAQGEATVIPSEVGIAADSSNKSAPLPDAARVLAFLAHEATHGWDNSPSRQVSAANWTYEAIADFLRLLWTNRTFSAPLGMNAATAAPGTFAGKAILSDLCLAPDLSLSSNGLPRVDNLYFVYQEPREYNLGCNLVRFAVQRAMANGNSLPTALGRFMATSINRRTYTGLYNAINVSSRADRDVWGEFFLTWAADGVAGASPDIQDALYQVKPAFLQYSSAYSWAIPERTIALGQAVSFALHEPSVHYYQVSSSSPIWVTYAGDGGAPVPTSRTGLAILRLQ